MAEYQLVLPAMGEGVMEATITAWVKNVGDFIEEDESVVEIATDKVDSDVPTPVSGKIVKILKDVNDIAKIGEAIAILEIEGEASQTTTSVPQPIQQEELKMEEKVVEELQKPIENTALQPIESDSFLSPLVKSICVKEGISNDEISNIKGSGLEGRITKEDVLKWLEDGRQMTEVKQVVSPQNTPKTVTHTAPVSTPKPVASGNDKIIEMDRMRKLIAGYMVESKRVSPHVTSFIETDVTSIVNWRNKNKDSFLQREGEKLTFMPIFVWAIAKAIKDFPMINVSVAGDTIIKKKNINIGMATALPSGNLIVPVIKNADQLNLAGLAKSINDLANRARNNQLKPHEIQGGTYTITNLGSFGNIMGTPIINQPEVAILAVGAIEKKPAVIETPQGDLIGIRHKMFMSHAYDHRVVDGALGGMFLQKVHFYLEHFEEYVEL